jgi:hypothetical protein
VASDIQGLPKNVGKGLVTRWLQNTKPKASPHEWNQNTNKALFEYHSQLGNRWSEISSKFSGCSETDVKNQFYSIIRKALRKGSKLCGGTQNSTDINLIKPKVLSDFMNRIINLQISGVNQVIKIRDLIQKINLAPFIEIIESFSDHEKQTIQKVIDELGKMKLF